MEFNRIPEFQPDVAFDEQCRRTSVACEIAATRNLKYTVRRYHDRKFFAGSEWPEGITFKDIASFFYCGGAS
jgi:hypothetical protein